MEGAYCIYIKNILISSYSDSLCENGSNLAGWRLWIEITTSYRFLGWILNFLSSFNLVCM